MRTRTAFSNIRTTLGVLRSVLLGQACAACATPCTGAPVCLACTVSIERLPRCPRCAIVQGRSELCGACISRPPAFEAAVTLGAFAVPLSLLVGQLKFERQLVLAQWFAQQLAPKLASGEQRFQAFDAIVPVPLHPTRLQARGFNQAHEIARHLAPLIGAPVLHALARLRDTPSQRTITANARFGNVKGAFAACAPVEGLRLVLLDDVVTTTATAQAAAVALRKAGAAQVVLACVARAGH
jgi:ComF family protein